jgi:adenosylcobyric acid synthase
MTRQVRVTVSGSASLWDPADKRLESVDSPVSHALGAVELVGYEIHMGRSLPTPASNALRSSMTIVPVAGGKPSPDGFTSDDGLVIGTYVHGLLENVDLRRALLGRLAARKGVRLPDLGQSVSTDEALDVLAASVRENLDREAIAEIAGLTF